MTISAICLIASILVISPGLIISWHLQFQGQIILIGLLLSVMNHCLMARVMPRTFLVLEARLGTSVLQHYSAILTNSYWAPNTGIIWRVVVLSFVLLPIGLSIGYKQFLGGVSSPKAMKPGLDGRYGVSFPSLGDFAPMNNSIYLMMNSAAEFMTASSNDSVPFPSSSRLPTPYGYNCLLLGNESAAVLDIPMPQYLQSMQLGMKSNETWRVSASVNAFVATYNRSTETLRASDDFWNTTMDLVHLHSFSLFDRMNEFSALVGWPQVVEGACYLLGSYPVSGGQGPDLTDVDSTENKRYISFRNSALMFNLRRQKCKGEWNVNRSSIRLASRDCGTSPTYVDSTVLQDIQLRPFWLDTLPVLVHSIGSFANTRSQSH